MPGVTRTQCLLLVLRKALFVSSFLLLAFPAGLRAQQSDDFDQYKVRLDTYWFYSNPGGSDQGDSDEAPVDFQKDLGFNGYSTFAAKQTGSSRAKTISTFLSAGITKRDKRYSIERSRSADRRSR